jgi:hypothetical protein
MRTLYLLDNVVGNSGYRWKGVFSQPTVWDGIDLKPYALAPTAMCLSATATVDTKMRSFFFLKKGETNCVGSKGLGLVGNVFDTDRTYPRANISQITTMQYSRANNADATLPYPCAEVGFHTINTLITALEVANHTKYIAKDTRYGAGISSTTSVGSENAVYSYGGVRCRVKDTDTWYYGKFSDSCKIYYTSTTSGSTNTNVLNQEYPKEQCEESQMAYSWAKEFGLADNLHFNAYGGEYWVIENPEAASDRMNARVYRKIAKNISAYDSAHVATEWELEVIMRMSLFDGVTLSGDIYCNQGGGIELMGVCLTSTSFTGQQIDTYMQNDQTKWAYETSSSHSDGSKFAFESTYRYLGRHYDLENGFARKRLSYSPCKLQNGGSTATGECFYCYSRQYWASAVGQRVRVGVRGRLAAHSLFSAPRSTYMYYSVGNELRFYCGSAQFLINVS